MAMKQNLACLLILSQITVDVAQFVFIRRTESQSLELSCSPQHEPGSVTAFHLYLRSGDQGQTTLLSVVEGSQPRVGPEGQGRLEVSVEAESPRLNVTMSRLRREDTGLYIAEFTYRPGNHSEDLLQSNQQVLLLVETTGEGYRCPVRYRSLLYTIFSAVGLLLLAFIWLATLECTRLRRRHKPRPPVPIYEEMSSSKQQGTGSMQNKHEGPSHLEEVDLPLYANSQNIRQAQDNHYACPRQIALRI